MPRQVSYNAMKAMLAQSCEQVFLEFLDITHPSLPSTLRVVNDRTDCVRNGHTYTAFPFSIDLPKDEDGSIEKVTLTISTIDQSIPNIIRTLPTAFTVTLNVALASSPDTTEAGPFIFTALSASYNGSTAQIDLGFYQYLLNQAFPGDFFAPYNATTIV